MPSTFPDQSLAYVALASSSRERADAIAVVDVGRAEPAGGRIVGVTELPAGGNELQRLGWSAPAGTAARRLLAPGVRSSCIHALDCERDPRRPALVRVIGAAELATAAGYAAPRAVHAGRDAVYVGALGAAQGDGAGGVLTLDPATLDVRGAWEAERGAWGAAGDVAPHEAQGVLVTGEWGAPRLVLDGPSLDCLAAGAYGHALHVWDMRTRTHRQRIELGAEQQMVLGLQAAHSPRRAYGFACVAASARDLSSAVFAWYLDREGEGGGAWRATRVIEIPAEPAPRDDLPPVLRPLGLVPPLATGLALSRDDRWLYVACWGTGEVRQYDVCDPFNPVLTGSVRLGGVAWRAPHPSAPRTPLDGGPCAIELSRDGRRVWVTSSFLGAWDAQLHPEAASGWMAALDAGAEGGLAGDTGWLVRFGPGTWPRHVCT